MHADDRIRSAAFVAVVAVEHVLFRRSKFAAYNLAIWDVPSQLPSGIAALGAAACSFALVIPCMSQTWYTGPIAESTGDIGFEVALVVTGVLYVPFRSLEIRLQGRR